jgi:hypothetical protein
MPRGDLHDELYLIHCRNVSVPSPNSLELASAILMSPLKVAERQYNTEIRKDSLQALASFPASDLILLGLVED